MTPTLPGFTPNPPTRAPMGAPRLAVLALLVTTSAAWSQDHAEIDRTQIIGNRELPKVTYIVPWKKPVQGALTGRPVAGVLDEALAPIDRDVFRRQIRYDAETQPAGPATPVSKK